MGGGSEGITTTLTQCITDDQPVPEVNQEEGCTETHTVNGNTVKFEMVCENSKSTGEVTYKDEAMEGKIQSQQTQDGREEVNATIELSGEYVGPCE